MQIKHNKRNYVVTFEEYQANHAEAIVLENLQGSREYTATANIPDYFLEQDEVAIKNYSENEGILESLVAAGILEVTGKTVQSGFVEFPICKILKRE